MIDVFLLILLATILFIDIISWYLISRHQSKAFDLLDRRLLKLNDRVIILEDWREYVKKWNERVNS